jgi:ABC-type transport system substrate-binding protein
LEVGLKIISLIASIFILIIGFSIEKRASGEMQSDSEVHLYNDFNLPLDPSALTTMSEYNLSLCLFQTIFIIEKDSTPVSNILESYKFDQNSKTYEFRINKKVKWSDGLSLTSDDIILSIKRLEKAAPGHFSSIETLLRIEKESPPFEKIDEFTLKVKVKEANDELFKRLSSVFIPIIRKDMIDLVTNKVTNHNITLGPYIIENSSSELLVLKKNSFYFKKRDDMPDRILMKNYPTVPVKANEILQKNSWPNLILDRVFIEESQWSALKKEGASFWTRPIDRVMFMIPGKPSTENTELVEILKWLGHELSKIPLDFREYPGVQRALSLQPKGFVLFKPLEYQKKLKPQFIKNKYTVALLNDQLPKDYLAARFKSLGLDVEISVFPVKAAKEIQKSGTFDFLIRTIGVADPDPITWLSLILLGSAPVISDANGLYKAQFEKIKEQPSTPQIQAEKMRELVHKAGIDGFYLPLAHFSSVAVANKGISFEGIWQTDETIDISKLKITK